MDIVIVGCGRGRSSHFQEGDPAEWQAQFRLTLSAAPDDAWARLFDDLRRKYWYSGLLPSFHTARVEGSEFLFFCHPTQLQSYVDQMAKVVAETNELYRRRLAQAEIWPTPEEDFEEMVQAALAALILPAEDEAAPAPE